MKKFEKRIPNGMIGSFKAKPEEKIENQEPQIDQNFIPQPILTQEEFEKQQLLYFQYLQEQQQMYEQQQYQNYLDIMKRDQEMREALEDEKKNVPIDIIVRKCHQDCISSNHFWKPNLISDGEKDCVEKCMKKLKKILPILQETAEKKLNSY